MARTCDFSIAKQKIASEQHPNRPHAGQRVIPSTLLFRSLHQYQFRCVESDLT